MSSSCILEFCHYAKTCNSEEKRNYVSFHGWRFANVQNHCGTESRRTQISLVKLKVVVYFIIKCAISTQYTKDSGILDYQKKGSELSELLNSDFDSVVVEGFIDQVLREKHFRGGVQCIWL